MSSLQPLRDFISERLSAAAEEICRHFEETIGHYEAELDRQRKLLDITLKPQLQLQSMDVPQHPTSENEDLCDQETNVDLQKDGLEPPQVKIEQEEFDINLSEEQLDLKLETENSILAPVYEEDAESDMDPSSHELASRSFEITVHPDHWEESMSMRDGRAMGQDGNEHHCEGGFRSSLFAGEDLERRDCKRNVPAKKKTKRSRKTAKGQLRNESDLNDCNKGHASQKTFCSRKCGKASKKKSQLEKAMRVPKAEKPYSCDACGKRFRFNASLSTHMRIHTGERPFSCKECGKQLRQSSHLVTHMRTHTGEKPFSCDVCGKRFTRKNYLLQHIRTHTGEKPFSCEECGKRFSRRSNLVQHRSTHSREKPFSCEECGKRFSRRFHLVPHVKAHGAEKPCASHHGIPEVDENHSNQST